MSCLYPNHDFSALMKLPNSNQFANCSHSVHIIVCLCKHVSKMKEFELAGKVKTNQRFNKMPKVKESWLVSLAFLLVL